MENKKKNNYDKGKGLVTGVEVVNSKSGKETLNLQLDPEKYKKLQDEHERNKRKAARKRVYDNTKQSIKKKIQSSVEGDLPSVDDKDREVKALKLEMQFINVIAMRLIIIIIAVILLVAKRESGISEHDNRELATFPEFSLSAWFDGSFTSGVTDYYTDTIPYRENLLGFSSKFSKLYGLNFKNEDRVVQFGNVGNVETEEFTGTITTTSKLEIFTGTQVVTTPQASETTPSVTTPQSEPGSTTPVTTLPVEDEDGRLSNGILIVGSGEDVRALEGYGGSFSYGKNYAKFVNKYKQDLGQYVNVYSMCIPTAFAFYCPENLKDNYGDQLDNINNIRSHLDGVIDIDIYSVLEARKNEYIYSRTDHHWQPIAAYYAAKVFADAAQVDYKDISTYEKVVEDDFLGTLYAYSEYDAELKKYPDTFTYYKPWNNSSLKVTYYDTDFKNGERSRLFFKAYQKINLYSSFLGDDKRIAHINNPDCKNGRTLVIFKDSFGNALVPFLTSSFENIYVVDLRYFTPNAIEFCQNVGATDVLFATCMFTCSSQKVNYIENIRVQ